MTTRAKNCTKKTNKRTTPPKKMDRQNPRTNGKNKALQTKSHKEASTYTLTKREKGKKKEKNIYINEESNQISKQIYQ